MVKVVNNKNQLNKFKVDNLKPRSIQKPRSIKELSELIQDLNAKKLGLIPFGGKTRILIGNLPKKFHTAVDLNFLPKDIIYEPDDMTLITSSNVTISEIENELTKKHQRLPFKISNPSTATIGGSVASDAEGTLLSCNGSIRDWIIGMKNISGEGTITKSGGKVVKNVTGYDVHKLHVGAYGSLGIIIECGIKLQPLPENTEILAIEFENFNTAYETALELYDLQFVLETINIHNKLSSNNNFYIYLQLAGSKTDVLRKIDEIYKSIKHIHNIKTDLFSVNSNEVKNFNESKKIGDLKIKISTLPSRLRYIIDFIINLSRSKSIKMEFYSDFSFGNIYFDFFDCNLTDSKEILNLIKSKLKFNVDSMTIQNCAHEIKKDIDIFFLPSAKKPLMEKIKLQYDPNNIMNPGRFAGNI